jgi:hypothetical protein
MVFEERVLMWHMLLCDVQLMKKATSSQFLGQSSPVEHLRSALQQVTFIQTYQEWLLCMFTFDGDLKTRHHIVVGGLAMA